MSARSGVLQRKCACGECEECKKKDASLQRRAKGSGPATAPPIVHDVLRSTGRPLDTATRAFMEARFAYDFGTVRVHADSRASESARAVNASAYTVGQDIVFGDGHYAPNTDSGRKLVAHELAHVVQQSAPGFTSNRTGSGGEIAVSNATDRPEQEADAVANAVLRLGTARTIRPPTGSRSTLRRQAAPSQNKDAASDKDVDRDKIIRISKGTGDITSRAWELVWRMLSRFFPEYVKSIAGVRYKENEPGVSVQVEESGAKDKKVQSATVTVGKKYVEGISEDTLRERIEELGGALFRLTATPDPKSGKGTGVVWKIINEKFPKKANRIAGTSYDANLPGLRTEFASGNVQAGSVKISWSGPALYFGSAFLDLPAAEQESKLREEFKKIDKWAVENFQVRKNDLEDEDITLRIRGLTAGRLTEFRDKTDDPAVKAYANSLRNTSTPMEKGLQMGADGKATVVIGAVTVVVEPDNLNATDVEDGATVPDIPWNVPPPKTEDGRVTELTQPKITITIRTSYGPDASPDAISGYGRGTTKSDEEHGADKLRVHEGSHGLDLIQFIKDHQFPAFTGGVGDTTAEFKKKITAFGAAVETYTRDLERYSVKSTDCTGITIDQFDDQRKRRHKIRCATPRAR